MGTGASEGYPALACGCDHCERARALGGPNLRRRSHALVDDQLLIDLGPDLLWSTQQYGLHLNHLRWVLLTHADGDHLFLGNLGVRRPPFATGDVAPWDVWGSAATLAPVLALPHFAELRLRARTVRPFETFVAGPYTVTALRAHHAPTQDPLCYVIRAEDAALLYATDSGPWFPETWAALEALGAAGVRLGAAIIEATYGVNHDRADQGHMSFQDVQEHAAGLRERGLLCPGAPLVTTHLAHAGVPDHEATAALLAPAGITAGYDGMLVKVVDA